MKKLRGQMWIYTLFIAFIGLIIALNLAPTVADQTGIAFSNATLFPANTPAKVVGELTPFVFVTAVVIAMIIMLNPFNRPEGSQ